MGSKRRTTMATLLLLAFAGCAVSPSLGAAVIATDRSAGDVDERGIFHSTTEAEWSRRRDGKAEKVSERGAEPIVNAINLLRDHGYQVCRDEEIGSPLHNDVQVCQPPTPHRTPSLRSKQQSPPSRRQRWYGRMLLPALEGEEKEEVMWAVHALGALTCVCTAALAAGLTLGMLGLDPLMLLIKERAGATEEERTQAKNLLPIIKQHHRLLVTLLLLNSISNEALPIFLEELVSPAVAVLLSVTLVLFGGEIIPSAIFTGPDQLKIASSLVPVVKTAMFVLYPIAAPIAKLLDVLLHDDDDAAAYNRGELSALIRIQYEARLANKRKVKEEKAQAQLTHQAILRASTSRDEHVPPSLRVGALDFSTSPSGLTHEGRAAMRFAQSHIDHRARLLAEAELAHHALRQQQVGDDEQIRKSDVSLLGASEDHGSGPMTPSERTLGGDYSVVGDSGDSIVEDEIMMMEGALQMKTKFALDVMTHKRIVFSLSKDTILTEKNMVHIYASGFSRIPVYQGNDPNAICAVLITKQLIVVKPQDNRPLHTLPLYTPLCVSPNFRLVDLLNLMQTGGRALKGGHLALVCARPKVGTLALQKHEPLPEAAGYMGVVTMEDILESLLQEEIYDEMDKRQRDAAQLSSMVGRAWRRHKRESMDMNKTNVDKETTKPTESTALLTK